MLALKAAIDKRALGMTATLSAILHTPHFIRMHVFGSKKWIEVLNDSHPDT